MHLTNLSNDEPAVLHIAMPTLTRSVSWRKTIKRRPTRWPMTLTGNQGPNGSPAIQPRGRAHYFINNTRKPMAMVWVYAGAQPERIEVNDDLATFGSVSGNPPAAL